MPDRSPAIAAAVRAVRGESDLDALMPALDDWRLAQVIACAPEAHPVAGAIAALHSGLPSALDPPTVADPALHDALAHLIGTPEGWSALSGWAHVAPTAWGRAHAEALIDAVHANMCDASAAAALIGPGDRSAVLLTQTYGMASAIRHWGQSSPAAPTAWAEALSPAERDRLITTLQRDPFQVASCLPWLPPDAANQTNIVEGVIGEALDAFAIASPTARAQHAAILRRLVARARPMHLDDLTRLACAMGSDDVWRRVQTLIQESPDAVWRVVAAAPWDDLPQDVRAAILGLADGSDVCAAVAAARGERTSDSISWKTAAAFFASLDPAVWDALDAATQQRWGQAALAGHIPLAVRSLGLRPEVLARATLDSNLARAVQRHAHDRTSWRIALLPVALRNLPLAAAHALIAAMPPPPDPGAFFGIASGRDAPDVLAPARSALRTPGDLALAVTLQRCAGEGARIPHACAVLRDALHGRTWDDLAPILPLLTDAARTACMPRTAIFARRLAHPDRRDALRRTLDRLAALPPAVAIPTHVALHRRTRRRTDASDAAEAIADALRDHGDLFLALADALTDALRAVVLPLPEDAARAGALRGLAQDDPPTAQRLARALRTGSWRDALITLLHAPPQHAAAVWQALSDDARRAIGAEVAAAPTDADPPAVSDPIAALALAALQSERDDLRNAGRAALTARCARIRAIWDDLPLAVRQMLGEMLAFADLSIAPTRPAIRDGIRRGRA